MELYMSFVKGNVILSAIIHFAILGTFGEIISKWMINKNFKFPFNVRETLSKMVIWAILGVCIKYTFKGFAHGYVPALINEGFLPQAASEGFLHAFVVSTFMNLQFGPFMVLFHRFLDNLATGQKNWKNIHKGIYCLLWFWIPAHTITFLLPGDLRILAAALWSLVLGLLLGYFNRK